MTEEIKIEMKGNVDQVAPRPSLAEPQPTLTNEINFTDKIWRSFDHMKSSIRPGSSLSSLFTIIISTVGGTILYMPSAFVSSGIIWSSLQILVCAVSGFYSGMMLVHAMEVSGKFSYTTLAMEAYGKKFKVYVKLSFILYNWGMIVTYMLLTGKLFSQFFLVLLGTDGPDILTNQNIRYFWQPLIMALVIFPLSLVRNLSSLSYTCIAATLFIIYMSIAVVVESFNVSPFYKNLEKAELFTFSGITSTFPAGVFAFTAHNNISDVHNELSDRTEKKMRKILLSSNMLVCIVYILVGIFGYISFADAPTIFDEIGGVILIAQRYISTHTITSALVMIALVMITAIPLNVKPCKDTLLHLLKPGIRVNDSTTSHFLLTLVVCLTSLACSLSIENIGDVITVLGSLTNPVICYTLPALFCLKLDPNFGGGKLKRGLIFFFFVLVMTLFGLYSLIVFVRSKMA